MSTTGTKEYNTTEDVAEKVCQQQTSSNVACRTLLLPLHKHVYR